MKCLANYPALFQIVFCSKKKILHLVYMHVAGEVDTDSPEELIIQFVVLK